MKKQSGNSPHNGRRDFIKIAGLGAGSLDDADRLFEEVKRSGLKYMMFETSNFHAPLYNAQDI